MIILYMKFLLIVLLCIILIYMLNQNIVEGSVQLPSGSNQVSIKNTEDLRTFLEQMYMVCLMNPNDMSSDKASFTDCYKMNILASYLWPTLGPYSYWSLEDLSPLFGQAVKQQTQTEKMAAQQNTTPPPIPVLINDTDYQLFLQLAILGRLAAPFVTDKFNNWNSAVVWFKDDNSNSRDACKEQWGEYQAATTIVNAYLTKITIILGYFHAQTTSNNKIHHGDSVYTSMYSSYTSSDDYQPSVTPLAMTSTPSDS